MIDFVLGIALAAMLVRGWLRGMVREVFDLVGLVVGIWIAFRLSAPFGEFLSDSFGLEPEVGRIGGGLVLFIMFGVLMSIGAHYLTKVMNLPGLTLVNRVGGAAVAVGWGILLVLVVVSVLSVLPIPASWREQLEGSNVVTAIAGEDAVPRRALEALAGDDVMASVASIRGLFGSGRAVPVDDEVLDIPPPSPDELTPRPEEAADVVELVNEHRVGVGLGAAVSVGAMDRLALEHATRSYRAGEVTRIPACDAELAADGYQVLRCENGVALAGTADGAFEGIAATAEGAAMLQSPDLDRVGVAVVDGPTGRLVVIILAG